MIVRCDAFEVNSFKELKGGVWKETFEGEASGFSSEREKAAKDQVQV